MSTKFVCPECAAAGTRAMILPRSEPTTTELTVVVFDDEETTQRHSHDPNVTTHELRCARDHEFTQTTCEPCWCGWSVQ